MISLVLDERSEAFRKDFSKWLQANPAPQLPTNVSLDEFVARSAEWQRKLAEGRWIAVHWPEQFGGRGLSLVEEAISQELLANVNSPQLINLFGLTMIGPVLIAHGTDAQRDRFLQKILTAEEIWCQGFSEPEAGSDLAALKTVAELSEDKQTWKIRGQKVWTSFAQYASYCFLLARSDSTVAKHEGLTYFLVEMKQPAITVRPLTQISGDREFNEVFFDGATAPQTGVVGKPGEGWKIAISTLMYERVVLTFQRHLQSETALTDLAKILSTDGRINDGDAPGFGRLVARSMAVRALALSHLLEYSQGKRPGPEGSLDKLFWSETFQEICEKAVEELGAEGILLSEDAPFGGAIMHRHLYSRGRTIAAGTSEIQRNIIGERVLGLPKS